MKNCKKTCHLRWWQKMVQISLMSRRDRLICSSNSSRNRRLGNWFCRMPPLWVVAETWVKSGEEWWRVVKSGEELSQLFTTRKRPVYRYFRRMGEEWRVFHDSIVYSDLGIRNPREMVLCSYLLWQVLLCYMDSQLADMETVGCSR